MTVAHRTRRLQVVQVYGGARLRRSHRPDRQRARRSRFDCRRRAAHGATARADGPRRRAPAIEPRRTARAPAGPHPVDDAGRVAGSVGRRCDLPQKQASAHGGIRVQCQRLRPRLRRGASGDLLQVARGEGRLARRRRRDSTRRPLERSRTRARAGDEFLGDHRRLHDRQRHELPRHRGREPALSAAGEDLHRLVHRRSMDCRRATEDDVRQWSIQLEIQREAKRSLPARPGPDRSNGRSRSSSTISSARRHSRTARSC